MIKVSELIERLKAFPPDALAYAYEGEIVGIVIVEPFKRHIDGGGMGRMELGIIEARE